MAMAQNNDRLNSDPITEWGHALHRCRLEAKKDYYTVANFCGVSNGVVKEWEDGTIIPSQDRLRRLHTLLPKLQSYKSMLPGARPIIDIDKDDEVLKAPMLAIAKLKSEETQLIRLPEPLIIQPRFFGEALKVLREQSGLSAQELAKLMGVTTGTIYSWEKGDRLPVVEHYRKLLDLFPTLQNAPKPNSKDVWPKPDSSASRISDKYQEPARTAPAKLDTAQLGSTYAAALTKLSAAQTKTDKLTKTLREAEEELKSAKAEVERAHEALKKATGMT